jgi:hypothetical protein
MSGARNEYVLSPAWSLLIKYGMVATIAVFYGMALLHFEYTPDDTYIYMQYASQLAEGEGFAFNAGEPSYGVTGPLWALLIAAGAAMGVDPYMVSKTLDLVLACLAVMLIYMLAYVVVRDKAYAVFAPAMLAFDGWFLRWAGSGMETSLSVLLVLLCIWYVYQNEYPLGALSAAVLTLIRPEGALLFVVSQIDNFMNTRDWRPAAKSFGMSCLVYALVIVPWLVFAFVQFGSIIPNTFAAKTGGVSLTEAWMVGASVTEIVSSTQGLSLIALAIGFVVGLRHLGWRVVRIDFFPVVWLIALPLAYAVFNVQVVSRYLLMILPIIIIYGLWGMKRMEEAWRWSEGSARKAVVVFALLSVTVSQAVYWSRIVPHMEQFAVGMNECIRPIAYWLRENTDAHATVLTPDVGMVGYISKRPMYDTAGLVTPEVKKAFGSLTYDEGMMEKRYESVVRPNYILDRGSEPERFGSEAMLPVMTMRFPSLGITKSGPVYYTLYRVAE